MFPHHLRKNQPKTKPKTSNSHQPNKIPQPNKNKQPKTQQLQITSLPSAPPKPTKTHKWLLEHISTINVQIKFLHLSFKDTTPPPICFHTRIQVVNMIVKQSTYFKGNIKVIAMAMNNVKEIH